MLYRWYRRIRRKNREMRNCIPVCRKSTKSCPRTSTFLSSNRGLDCTRSSAFGKEGFSQQSRGLLFRSGSRFTGSSRSSTCRR
jgi:hypothetical protein